MAARDNQVLEAIEELKELLQRHTEADDRNFRELRSLLEGNDTTLGIKIRIDRLEQSQAARIKQLGYLWSAIATVAAGVVLKVWLG